jgi:hypothetical protein
MTSSSTTRRNPSTSLGRFALGFLVAATVVAACGDSSPSPQTSAGPVGSATRDGLVVTVALDRAVLPSGDRTLAVVTVENRSPERRFYQGGGCDFLADVQIETTADVVPDPGVAWPGAFGRFKDLLRPAPIETREGYFVDERFADPTQIMCTADLGINEIGPGQRLEMRALWNGEISGTVAAPGPGRVIASFPYLGLGIQGELVGKPPQAIAATIAVDVADVGIRLLSPGQVIDAALGDPQFSGWLAAAGHIQGWDSVSLEGQGHVMVVVLGVQGVEGRASVDRVSGAVIFAKQPRP